MYALVWVYVLLHTEKSAVLGWDCVECGNGGIGSEAGTGMGGTVEKSLVDIGNRVKWWPRGYMDELITHSLVEFTMPSNDKWIRGEKIS